MDDHRRFCGRQGGRPALKVAEAQAFLHEAQITPIGAVKLLKVCCSARKQFAKFRIDMPCIKLTFSCPTGATRECPPPRPSPSHRLPTRFEEENESLPSDRVAERNGIIGKAEARRAVAGPSMCELRTTTRALSETGDCEFSHNLRRKAFCNVFCLRRAVWQGSTLLQLGRQFMTDTHQMTRNSPCERSSCWKANSRLD